MSTTLTKFGQFLKGSKIDRRLVSLVSRVSMDHVIRLCYHTSQNGPTLRTIRRLLSACSAILHRNVKAEELFDMRDGGERRIANAIEEILSIGASSRGSE